MATKVTYRVVLEHIGGDLNYGSDYLELIPKEFETRAEAAAECIRLRDRMIENAKDEYQKIAKARENEDEWETQASVEWGNRGDIDIFRTCMFGYHQYD